MTHLERGMLIQRIPIVRRFRREERILVDSKSMAPLHLQDFLTVVQPHLNVLVVEQSQ